MTTPLLAAGIKGSPEGDNTHGLDMNWLPGAIPDLGGTAVVHCLLLSPDAEDGYKFRQRR